MWARGKAFQRAGDRSRTGDLQLGNSRPFHGGPRSALETGIFAFPTTVSHDRPRHNLRHNLLAGRLPPGAQVGLGAYDFELERFPLLADELLEALGRDAPFPALELVGV